jgi:inorganic pyrophosphatase
MNEPATDGTTDEDPDLTVDVVVEIPRGSRNKYEYDESQGIIRLDRRITGPVAFPADYGFVPGTASADGEPLDALVLVEEPTYPGVWVTGRPVGVCWIRTSGGREAKLIVAPTDDPAWVGVTDLDQLPRHRLAAIENFFDVYKMLDERSSASADGHDGAGIARRVVTEARQRHADKEKNQDSELLLAGRLP